MTKTSTCPECGGVAHLVENMETIYDCETCEIEFMNNNYWNNRFQI